MLGRAYTFFDTAIGRCAIAWGEAGIVGVQLPEAREIETHRRLFQLYPEARETRPTPNAEAAIEGIVALLRGGIADFADVMLDMGGIPVFDQRVYLLVQRIPHGETRTYNEVAARLGTPSACARSPMRLSTTPLSSSFPVIAYWRRAAMPTGCRPMAG